MSSWTKRALGALVLLFFSCSHSQNTQRQTVYLQRDSETVLDILGIQSEVARNPKYKFQLVASFVQDGIIDTTFSYNTDTYYYPASLVKIPAALVLLEELKAQNIPLDAIPVFDTINTCGSLRFVELSQRKSISFRQMLRELIVVSDNHFYNALYHFISPERLNLRLRELGFGDVHLYRAFTGCNRIDQLRTYPYKVYSENGAVLFEKEATVLDSAVLGIHYEDTDARRFGSKHENAEGAIVMGSYDLNYQLEIPLESLHEMLGRFLFPESYFAEHWDIRKEDALFFKALLETYPSEISSSYQNIRGLSDTVYKYAKSPDANMRALGKLGLSYGFASEVGFIPTKDAENGLLFAYSVYVNENDTVNDGDYEYESVARPFAEDLVEALLKWQVNNQ